MARHTKIEWTDFTFNPWHGCTKVSPGCQFCYAAQYDKRHLLDDVVHWGPGARRLLFDDAHWREPEAWDRAAARAGARSRVFCASMADVFEEEAPRHEQLRLWDLIERTPNLDWQLLTKRPERILAAIPRMWRRNPPSNVWYGTSVETADYVWRIAELRRVPAVIRFLSIEPLLGPIPRLPLRGIHWVILGGESGPGARPMEIAWARGIRDRALKQCVPFFFKQFGRHDASGVRRSSKEEAGRMLDGRTWDEFPDAPGALVRA